MSNVFISHSSVDKPFVRRLATALLAEGFPVWLDSWELELGDSLLDRIYEGIDSSSVVLLVISKSANSSGWVNKELNAALSKEEIIGRTLLIPLKVDDTALPLKIADRLYSDFSRGFSQALSNLTSILEKRSARKIAPPAERELVAAAFTNEVHLNTTGLFKTVRAVEARQGVLSLSSHQIVLNNDEEYYSLQDRLHRRIDNIASDPYFSQEFERSIRGMLQEMEDGERVLREGLALMINNRCSEEATYWFTKIVRARLVYRLWYAQSPDSPSLNYGRDWACASLNSNFAATKFFGSDAVEGVNLWEGAGYPTEYFSIWIGAEALKRIRNEEGVYEGPAELVEVCRYSDIDKYVLPQVVLQHLERGTTPIPWKLNDAFVGIR